MHKYMFIKYKIKSYFISSVSDEITINNRLLNLIIYINNKPNSSYTMQFKLFKASVNGTQYKKWLFNYAIFFFVMFLLV